MTSVAVITAAAAAAAAAAAEKKKHAAELAKHAVHRLIVSPTIPPQATAAQEVANAATMWLSSFVALYYLNVKPGRDPLAILLSQATFVHLPFSTAWHLSAALGRPSEALKKLDISMIHAVSAVYAFCTTASLAYALVALSWSAYASYIVWRGQGQRKAERSRGVLISVLIYALPIAARGDWATFGACLLTFAVAGGTYQLHTLFDGWDHAVFHVFMALFQHWMLVAASNCYSDNRELVDALITKLF